MKVASYLLQSVRIFLWINYRDYYNRDQRMSSIKRKQPWMLTRNLSVSHSSCALCLHTACCTQHTAYCTQHTAHSKLLTAHCSLLAARCSLHIPFFVLSFPPTSPVFQNSLSSHCHWPFISSLLFPSFRFLPYFLLPLFLHLHITFTPSMSSSPLFILSFYHTIASGLLTISKASTMAHMRPLRVTDFEYALARTRKAGIWVFELFSASCCRDLGKEFITLLFKFLSFSTLFHTFMRPSFYHSSLSYSSSSTAILLVCRTAHPHYHLYYLHLF
jgi:hypothetical protein